MAKICVLPPEIVNRIAAGEVVERPASLVKELVENSIDAGATEIDIDLEEGGCRRVTVKDNGGGMDSDDLQLAFQSHATSKLDLNDASGGLFGIATLGFRGEALSSIGAVADVEVVSQTPKADHAFRFLPSEGKIEPAAGELGTVIEVRNLFYNVPARRKFLRSASAELSRIVQQVTRIALGYPDIRFRVTHRGKKSVDFPQASGLRERISQIVGGEKAEQLLEVREGGEGDSPMLRGYVGAPRWRAHDSRHQHFFVNGRWVKDRTLSHALRSAFQGFLIPGWYPVAYLFLVFEPDAVDVNVHPTKSEVRFRDSGSIYPLVFHAVKSALTRELEERTAPPEEAASVHGERGGLAGSSVIGSSVAGSSAASSGDIDRMRVARAARDFFEAHENPPTSRTSSGVRADETDGAGSSLPSRSSLSEATRRTDLPDGSDGDAETAARGHVKPERIAPGHAERGHSSRPSRAFQILDSYLVVDDGDGVRFIDQHALHEKILYEEIFDRLQRGDVLKQKLMVPEIVELPLELMPLVEKAAKLLSYCGYDVESFGDREVAVHAEPKIFERLRSVSRTPDFILEVFRWLAEDGDGIEDPSPRDADGLLRGPYRRLASIMACKRAVKAGARLSPEEIDSLLEKADLAEDPRHCPHGRPTTVKMSSRELELRFDRK